MLFQFTLLSFLSLANCLLIAPTAADKAALALPTHHSVGHPFVHRPVSANSTLAVSGFANSTIATTAAPTAVTGAAHAASSGFSNDTTTVDVTYDLTTTVITTCTLSRCHHNVGYATLTVVERCTESRCIVPASQVTPILAASGASILFSNATFTGTEPIPVWTIVNTRTTTGTVTCTETQCQTPAAETGAPGVTAAGSSLEAASVSAPTATGESSQPTGTAGASSSLAEESTSVGISLSWNGSSTILSFSAAANRLRIPALWTFLAGLL